MLVGEVDVWWWLTACTGPDEDGSTTASDATSTHTGSAGHTGEEGPHTGDPGDHTGGLDDSGPVPDPPASCAVSDGDVVLSARGAFRHLQPALDANVGGEVLVCRGTYAGPFVASGPITVRNGDAPGSVRLHGDGVGPVITGGDGLVLDGLVIDGGGAGVALTGGDATVRACVVHDNLASGITVSGSGTVTLDGTDVSFNTGTDGGGLSVRTAHVALVDSEVHDNTAGRGGGAWVSQGSLSGGTFTANTAAWGGGVYLDLSDAADLVITGNTATSGGGGARLHDTADLRSSTVEGNTAPLGAGLHLTNLDSGSSGMPGVHDSTVRANVAAIDGGGVFEDTWNGSWLDEVVVEANVAERGAGAWVTDRGSLEVDGGAFRANVASVAGGALGTTSTTYSLDLTRVDLGSGVDDNAPDDLWVNGVATVGLGVDVTVACGPTGCR